MSYELTTAADLRAVQLALGIAPRRIRIAAQHGGWNVLAATRSNGTAVSGTDRHSFTPNTDIVAPQFLMVNGYADATGLVNATGNAVQFYSGIEIGGNQLVPISFEGSSGSPISTGGKTGSYISDGAYRLSNPVVGGPMLSGVAQFYRVFKKVAAGEKWPFTHDKTFTAWGGLNTTDAVYGASITDQSDQTASQAAQAWGPYTSTAYAWMATAVIAEQITPVPVVMITGDSIGQGTGDIAGRGFIGRACTAAGVAYHNDGLAGASLNNLSKYGQISQLLAGYVDHVVIQALINDLPGLADLAAAKAVVLTAARAYGRKSNRLWFCTLPPRTTGAWTSYGAQAVAATETLRVQVNNWLRDPSATGAVAYLNGLLGVGRVAGFIDACPYIEKNSDGSALVLDANGQQTAATGGFWNAASGTARTADGIHPNTTATSEMGPAVPTASFTIV